MNEEFLTHCKEGDNDKILLLLAEKRADVNATDSEGMTGLMHAAFNGHADTCSLLLKNGANVDMETTKDYITALMFATLGGRTGAVEVLLRGGANPDKRNKAGKTASNLGAFIGSKECLRIINNYLPLSEITYHTVPRNLDQADFLPPDLAPHLHHLCCMNNLNPVKMLVYVKEHPAVVAPEHRVQVNRILERMIDKHFKKEVNEVIAFKLHYINNLLNVEHVKNDGVDGAIKHFLLGRKGDGFSLNIEQFVRSTIRSFKFVTSTLVSQLVRVLAPITPGAGKPALYYVMTTLNGRYVDVDEFACRACGEMDAEKRCSACKQVFYCNAACQKMHWFTHKKVCDELSKRKPKCRPLEEELAQQPAPLAPPPPPPPHNKSYQQGHTPPPFPQGHTPPPFPQGQTPPPFPQGQTSPPFPQAMSTSPGFPQGPTLTTPVPGFIKSDPGVLHYKTEENTRLVREEVLDSNIIQQNTG